MRNFGACASLGGLVLLLALGILLPAHQEKPAPPQDLQAQVTRADFALALVRFERAILRSPLGEADIIRVNKEFDALTLLFFLRKYGEAIEKLNTLTFSLATEQEKGGDFRFLASLRIRISPPVFRLGGADPTLEIDSIYPARLDAEKWEGSLLLFSEGKKLQHRVPIVLESKAGALLHFSTRLQAGSLNFIPGYYEIGLGQDAKNYLAVGRWTVVRQSLDSYFSKNEAEIQRIRVKRPELVQALASVQARNRLLSDNPSPENTAQMLLDPRRLATEVGSEVRSIKAGQNPYRDRRGDTWRVLKTEDGEIPLRLYLSRSPDKNKLLPVVIALHGAGGDENMFPEAYGAGLIKKLAEKHGFLLVSPLADDFSGARAGQNLEALIGVLKTDYPIDMSRIYVLGHSRGGMLAGSLASIRAERIAAACCICGFQGFGPNVKVIAPTYVIAAELDPLVSFTRIEPAVRKAQEAGLPVEYKLISGYGHTLVVSLVLPEVIPWLLQHRIGK